MELLDIAAIIGAVVAVIGLIWAIAVPLKGYFHKRKKKEKAFFDVVWKHASALTSEEVMSYRGRKENGYDSYYYPRQVDDKIKELIRNKKNVVVLGKPLAGKTRSVYEALKSLDEPAVVTIPRMIDINPLEFEIPANTKMPSLEILLVDDVGKFLAKPNFAHVLREFVKRRTVIVATCWLDEWDGVKQKLEQEAGLHFGEPITQEDITGDEAEDVATQAQKAVPKTFDGNIGSIFVDLDEMKRRYSTCSAEEKALLRSVKRLYQAGVYEGREVFSLDMITAVGEKAEGITGQQYQRTALVDGLTGQGFCTREGEGLHFEEAHLQYVVEGDFTEVADFQLLANLFQGDPETLFKIGKQAFRFGLVDLQKANYVGMAISAYKGVLRVRTYEHFPIQYGVAQHNLGAAYGTLAEVTEKAMNCGHAIAAYNEALRVYTYDDLPMDYGTTQISLGNAYSRLAEATDTASNCGYAIAAYKEALGVRSFEDLPPMYYGRTQSNLGAAYSTLAEVTDKASNCGYAIAAFKEALRVITYEDSPIDYAVVQNNLGTAYAMYAEVKDTAFNCQNAIAAFEKALMVRTFDEFPLDYAMTQNNLGYVFRTLAEVKDKVSNCERAIASLREALRVYTCDDFPIDYGMTQNNLGATYHTLAGAKGLANNSRRAITALKEALRVRTYEDYPFSHGETLLNLASVYQTLAEISDKTGNCARARELLETALKVFEEQWLPDLHQKTLEELEALAAFCEGGDESDS